MFFAESLRFDELDALAERVTKRKFAKGETLIREDDLGTSMFVLETGEVAVTVLGYKAPVAMLGPGDIIGEMSLLTGSRRSATVTATTSVEAVEIGKAALAPLLVRSPELAERFAASLEKRQKELDRRYGQQGWRTLLFGRSELHDMIRAFFAQTM